MPVFSNPAAYELWMGRWSARLAPAFLTFAAPPPGARVLDIGSGTGALARAVIEADPAATVTGIELSEVYVAHSRATLPDPRLGFLPGDALALPVADAAFDAVLSHLVLQEIPDAPRAVAEMRRVTRPGGVVAASQWDFAAGMPMLALFWEAASEVAPGEATREAARRCMEVAHPDGAALATLWREAGLGEVSAARQRIELPYAGFADYWQPFLSNVSAASSFASTLGAAAEELARHLRHRILGDGPDRPFILAAHAWAVRGAAPAG